MKSLLLVSSLLLVPSLVTACPCHPAGSTPVVKRDTLKRRASRAPSQATTQPFGGSNASIHQIEATLANFIKKQLDEGYAQSDVREVIVSFPAQIEQSDYSPYGDGQTNARAGFGPHWSHATPPLAVMREILKSGKVRELLIRHPAAMFSEVDQQANGEMLYLRPKGWKDGFAFSFDAQTLAVSEFMKGIPKTLGLSLGRKLPDPEKIASEKSSSHNAFQALLGHRFGHGYNSDPYEAPNVHGRFPDANGVVTAVGKVWTWLAEPGAHSGLKHLYTCFEGRNLADESKHGVPSGAGWHRVGDPAETVLNSLEDGRILIALAKPTDKASAPYPLAYGFGATITARYLDPSAAFVTKQGQFHWYAVLGSREACTEIWVHPCVPGPSNFWGFSCGS